MDSSTADHYVFPEAVLYWGQDGCTGSIRCAKNEYIRSDNERLHADD